MTAFFLQRILLVLLASALGCGSVCAAEGTDKLSAAELEKLDELRLDYDLARGDLGVKQWVEPMEKLRKDFKTRLGRIQKGFEEIGNLQGALAARTAAKVDPTATTINRKVAQIASVQTIFVEQKKKIEGSFSAYYDFSRDDNQKISSFILERLDKDFNYHLSSLAGYRCNFKAISYSLGIVCGENSNSEMHQDSFASIAKGFIYLQDITEKDAPFEYLEGSYIDAAFRSSQTNKAVINGDPDSTTSTRLRGKDLDDAINQYPLISFTGKKGFCNSFI